MASLCLSFSSNLLISAMASAISSSSSLDSLKIKLKKMCSGKMLHVKHVEGIGISWGWGNERRKKCMNRSLSGLSRGVEVLKKTLPRGSMDIFLN